MNVLLVTVDSLRADRVTEGVMPKTRSFADAALEFTDCVANGSSTPASFPSILASRHFASIDGLGLPEAGAALTLAERLRQAGYRTAGFTDNHFASGSYHFDRGFDSVYDASGSMEAGNLKQFVQSNLDKDGPLFRTIERVYTRLDSLFSTVSGDDVEYERAGSLNERVLSFIDTPDSDDWFVWLHYMDAHHPYEAPDSYQRQFLDEPVGVSERRTLSRTGTHYPEEMSDSDWERLEALYNAECAYVDDQFAELIEELEQRELRDDTMTVFTADHGELFGEHGAGGHPGEFWEGVIRVPLLIDIPEYDHTVSEQVQLLDISPTIVDALGETAVGEWSGESLLPIAEGADPTPLVFGDVGRKINYEKGYVRRSDGWKLLDHADDGEFLFNVRETPAERPKDERSDDKPAVLSELRNKLQEHRDRMTQSRRGVEGINENGAMVEEHLEALGYR
jgi:arylsulfatase A-like enzyme